MARLSLTMIQHIRKKKAILVYTLWMRMVLSFNAVFQLMYLSQLTRRTLRERYTIFKMERNQYIHRLIHEGPSSCVENLRMDKRSFYKLFFMLESRGYVQESRHVNVVEKVAMFLNILGHHTKMRIVHTDFQRSKQSITRYFHAVLNGVLRLQGDYFKKPEPIQSNSTDKTWKHFKVYVKYAIFYIIYISSMTMCNLIMYIYL